MTVERRKAEASGLRGLFSRQWAHVNGLFNAYGERLAAQKQQDVDEL